jgi:hypothetical protein
MQAAESRFGVERCSAFRGSDGIANAADGLNQRIARCLIDLCAQIVDVNIRDVGKAFKAQITGVTDTPSTPSRLN